MKNLKKKDSRKSVKISKNKKEKGITLIALVITIIVLLILAGISIAMLTGNNGVLTKATEAKDETTQAKAEEMVKLAIGSLQTKNLGDRSQITPEAIANQVMEDNDIENVTAEGSEFPTNIIFADDGVKIEVNLDSVIEDDENDDDIYSEEGLEDKIAPEYIFNYEIIDSGEIASNGMSRLSDKTVKITSIKPQYCNFGGYDPETEESITDTNYEIKLDDGTIINDILVIPYEVDGKNVPNGIEGEKYTVIQANIGCYWKGEYDTGYCFPKVETIIYPNTIRKIERQMNMTYDENVQKLILSKNLESIESNTFYNCRGLTEVIIPSGEKRLRIENSAFNNCRELIKVTIPENVVYIGEYVFRDCNELSTIIYKNKEYTSSTTLIKDLEADGVTVEDLAFSWSGF